MPVRILVGMSGEPVHGLEHAIAHVVLEDLGVVVHLGPVEAEHLDQEGLEDAMAPHHFERAAPARGGCATRRSAARRPSMFVTEGAETSSRAASREVGTVSPPGASS